MSQESELLATVVGVLESMHVPYMVGGSVALSVWATPRLTHDIDVVADLPEDRIAEFCARFPQDRLYLDPGAMRLAFRQRAGPGSRKP